MDIPMSLTGPFGQERCRARTGTTGATGASLSVPSKETSEAFRKRRVKQRWQQKTQWYGYGNITQHHPTYFQENSSGIYNWKVSWESIRNWYHTFSNHQMAMDQYLYIPFLGGWTSINPSYFDVNRRGTRFWHTAILWDFLGILLDVVKKNVTFYMEFWWIFCISSGINFGGLSHQRWEFHRGFYIWWGPWSHLGISGISNQKASGVDVKALPQMGVENSQLGGLLSCYLV